MKTVWNLYRNGNQRVRNETTGLRRLGKVIDVLKNLYFPEFFKIIYLELERSRSSRRLDELRSRSSRRLDELRSRSSREVFRRLALSSFLSFFLRFRSFFSLNLEKLILT